MEQKANPVVYFEIPVNDINRAIRFYNTVFGFAFEKEQIDGNAMAHFPFEDSIRGISGSLAKGDSYIPSTRGVLLYFYTASIEETVKKAIENGAALVYPITENKDLGFAIAEIQDSEGNRIGLHQKL
ncbi:VOC family protein [Sphingobacterium sp. Mn56C]|uniref:VOC family protein n=1 Tax=Sphingobacterium sp. Mn56C TaxID=3395261 RepID=UPI003BCB4E47